MMNLNGTVVTEFLLLGFSTSPEQQVLLFVALLAIYLVTVVGNLLIILVTLVDPVLHTSMYIFLSNLSALEVGYTSVTVPKMLVSLISGDKHISFAGCAMQMGFFLCFGSTESSFLTTMAYDRYVAICSPLCYTMIMNKKVCVLLAATSWTIAMMVLTFMLPFCASKEVGHFFCHFMPLLKLSCTDTHLVEFLSFTVSACVTLVPFLLILTSYYKIILTIQKIPSTTGKQKASFTCSSHLPVVSIFYGTVIIVYVAPAGNQSPALNEAYSLLYTVISPMFNPLIYRLRNKEVKGALQKVGSKLFTFLNKSNIP
uniref:Olfactory receptor n=1 Tax=Gopherus evgoodei TaxID=1825980 RepID=A0A8C5F362_9SAUR